MVFKKGIKIRLRKWLIFCVGITGQNLYVRIDYDYIDDRVGFFEILM